MKKIYLKMGFIVLTLLLILTGCQANHGAKTGSTNSQAAVTNTSETSVTNKSVPPTETPATAADPTKNWLPAVGPISFPVLMYHSLAVGNSLMMPPDQFKQQLQWLKDNDYYTLTPEEAYLVLTTNKKPADKIVWITLDDGYRNPELFIRGLISAYRTILDQFSYCYGVVKPRCTVFAKGYQIMGLDKFLILNFEHTCPLAEPTFFDLLHQFSPTVALGFELTVDKTNPDRRGGGLILDKVAGRWSPAYPLL